jgi:hypothetical protein
MFCFNGGSHNPFNKIIGICLIVVGLILVLCFMPGWLWCAFIGIVMIVIGILMLIGSCRF